MITKLCPVYSEYIGCLYDLPVNMSCDKLEKINLKSFNTKNVTDMIAMFFQCVNYAS